LIYEEETEDPGDLAFLQQAVRDGDSQALDEFFNVGWGDAVKEVVEEVKPGAIETWIDEAAPVSEEAWDKLGKEVKP
jgi:hypothetical protein